jgi:hypothetical protein
MSSMWVGMYRCIRKYVERGWLAILIICRYGDISSVVGILVILPGNAYSWCIRVSSPPLGLLYGCPWIRWGWVFVVVLLNIILYCGNNLWRYLVDLDVVSLVSCMAIMEGGVGFFINACRLGNAVLSAPQFHDNMLVVGFVCGVLCACRIGWS